MGCGGSKQNKKSLQQHNNNNTLNNSEKNKNRNIKLEQYRQQRYRKINQCKGLNSSTKLKKKSIELQLSNRSDKRHCSMNNRLMVQDLYKELKLQQINRIQSARKLEKQDFYNDKLPEFGNKKIMEERFQSEKQIKKIVQNFFETIQFQNSFSSQIDSSTLSENNMEDILQEQYKISPYNQPKNFNSNKIIHINKEKLSINKKSDHQQDYYNRNNIFVKYKNINSLQNIYNKKKNSRSYQSKSLCELENKSNHNQKNEQYLQAEVIEKLTSNNFEKLLANMQMQNLQNSNSHEWEIYPAIAQEVGQLDKNQKNCIQNECIDIRFQQYLKFEI